MRASPRPRASSATSVISSSKPVLFRIRCRPTPPPAWRPRPGRLPPRANNSACCVARSSSASTPPPSRSSSRRLDLRGDPLPPLPFDGAAMDAQSPGKRLDGGEQPLLQAGDEQGGDGLLALGSRRAAASRGVGGTDPAAATAPVLGRLPEGRRCRSAARCGAGNRADRRLLAEVFLEPADHHVVEKLLALHRHAAAEALRDRGSPAGRRSCWNGRCAAWRRGTGGAQTAGRGRGRPW